MAAAAGGRPLRGRRALQRAWGRAAARKAWARGAGRGAEAGGRRGAESGCTAGQMAAGDGAARRRPGAGRLSQERAGVPEAALGWCAEWDGTRAGRPARGGGQAAGRDRGGGVFFLVLLGHSFFKGGRYETKLMRTSTRQMGSAAVPSRMPVTQRQRVPVTSKGERPARCSCDDAMTTARPGQAARCLRGRLTQNGRWKYKRILREEVLKICGDAAGHVSCVAYLAPVSP